MNKETQTEKFCHSILGLEVNKSKALANLVMGLSRQQGCESVTALSLSRCYHYQYSSISKVLSDLSVPKAILKGAADSTGGVDRGISERFLEIKRAHFPKPFDKFWLINTDVSSLFRLYSPTLPNRGYVYRPNNQIKGNTPVDVGYSLSTVGLSARQPLYGLSEAPWNLPLSMRLVPFDQNSNSFTATQVNELLNNDGLPFGNELTLNALDSKYAAPEYIAQTYGQDNLVNVIRLASNRNVWKKLSPAQQQARRTNNADNRGAKAIYGLKYKLSEASGWDLEPDQAQEFGIKLASGKRVILRIALWEEMMLRSKRGLSMKDKDSRLVRVDLIDPQTHLPLYKRSMWLGVWGKRKKELSLDEIFWAYRNRFDLEHFFRFGKQRLLLDQFQTPEEDHWSNWLEVVSCAYWLLWVASQEASHTTKKWQQYDKHVNNRRTHQLRPSPSQVQQQLESIILGFDKDPFLPKPSKKGTGRKTGTVIRKRTKYPIRKKTKKRKKQPT